MAEQSPRSLDYSMPAEWEHHECTWLQWPQNKVYSRYELKLEGIWLNLVDALNDHENVHLVVADERQRHPHREMEDMFRNRGEELPERPGLGSDLIEAELLKHPARDDYGVR